MATYFERFIQENKDWNYTVEDRHVMQIILRAIHPREQGLKLSLGLRIWSMRISLRAIHPREQGLKHDSQDHRRHIPIAFERFIQENKDWNMISTYDHGLQSMTSSESSKRTRIETRYTGPWLDLTWSLRAIHPREQGLKHEMLHGAESAIPTSSDSSKRTRIETRIQHESIAITANLRAIHPREQGLKPETVEICCHYGSDYFERIIQENKDWNSSGLRWYPKCSITSSDSSKRTRIETKYPRRDSEGYSIGFERFIQENKDWNIILWYLYWTHARSSSDSSKRTRIETWSDESCCNQAISFERIIQENKDWNYPSGITLPHRDAAFERFIQENKDWNNLKFSIERCSRISFERFIQENKDWNWYQHDAMSCHDDPSSDSSKRTRIETDWYCWPAPWVHWLRAIHPREQGLKPNHDRETWHIDMLRAIHPREQGLKPISRDQTRCMCIVLRAIHPREQGLKLVDWRYTRIMMHLFERFIQENKDWNITASCLNQSFRELRAIHPREQGLKQIRWTRYRVADRASSDSSKRTRIETRTLPFSMLLSTLRAIHPREQGLKPMHRLSRYGAAWLLRANHPREQGLKHRDQRHRRLHFVRFERIIQENKDWNRWSLVIEHAQRPTSSESSKRTRIETLPDSLGRLRYSAFERIIQENKDWNHWWVDRIIWLSGLRANHPREQGLKP